MFTEFPIPFCKGVDLMTHVAFVPYPQRHCVECVHVCMPVCVHMCMSAYMCVHMCMPVCMCVCVHMCMCMYVCMCRTR